MVILEKGKNPTVINTHMHNKVLRDHVFLMSCLIGLRVHFIEPHLWFEILLLG